MANRIGGKAAGGTRRLRRLASKGTWTEADARELLAAREASGLTQAEFSRRYGAGGGRLWWWQKRVKAAVATPPAMLRVHVRGAEPHGEKDGGAVVEVVVAGKVVRVPRGFDAAELRRLVAALEGACGSTDLVASSMSRC